MLKESERLGNYLRDKRVESGYSQNDVAGILGYKSAQFISNIERGVCSPPMKALKVFMDLYKIPKKEIFELLMVMKASELQNQIFGRKPKKVPTVRYFKEK